MKIEIDKWLRTAYGLNKVIRIDDEVEDTCGLIHLNDSTFYNFYTKKGKVFLEDGIDYKVADTPQELIQDIDIVEANEYYEFQNPMKVYSNVDGVINVSGKCGGYKHDEITKIYTPNEDKSQYTLQWEAK